MCPIAYNVLVKLLQRQTILSPQRSPSGTDFVKARASSSILLYLSRLLWFFGVEGGLFVCYLLKVPCFNQNLRKKEKSFQVHCEPIVKMMVQTLFLSLKIYMAGFFTQFLVLWY